MNSATPPRSRELEILENQRVEGAQEAQTSIRREALRQELSACGPSCPAAEWL